MPHLSPPDGHSSFPAENVRVEAEEVGCYIEAAVDLIFKADANKKTSSRQQFVNTRMSFWRAQE